MLKVKLGPFKNPKGQVPYRGYDTDAMTDAYLAVKDDCMPVRKAARLFCVPETSLRRRVNGSVHIDCVKSGPDPLFSMEQEVRLVDHVKLLARVGYGYSRGELCNLATEFAIDLGLRDREHPLSLQWYRNFRGRWPQLTAKVPRTLSIARAKGTSESAVKNYFQELDAILTKYQLKDKPQHIYNVDEKGLTSDHTPPKIVTEKGDAPVAVTAGRSYTVTILGAGNAVGAAIPPYFIFPGKRMRLELMEGATPGARGTVSDSGWSNGDIFRSYLQEHFLEFVQGRNHTQPILLLYDGHRSHISIGLIDWAKENNIILFVLPPHTSHVLQPLDVGCFGPFQKIYDNLRHKFTRYNLKSSVPKDVVCELGCKAYNLSLSQANLVASFRKCGISPFNPLAVDSIVFMPSSVFKKPLDEEKDQVKSSPPGKVETNDKAGENQDTEAEELSQQVTRFFRNKEGVLCKSSDTKKRKVLSAVVGGKAITEDHIVEKIKVHLEEQKTSSTKKPKLEKTEISCKKNGKPACKKNKGHNNNKCQKSPIPGPSGLQPMLIEDSTDSSDDDDDDDDDDVPEQDLCCVCKKFSPVALRELGYIEFLQWGECTFQGCGHWVHLKYCTPVRFLRRHDEFACPCHKYSVPDSPFSVPVSVNTNNLSSLINGLLSEPLEDETSLEFDFLVDGEFLQVSLEKHLEQKNISTETVVDIEYVERHPAPEPEDSLNHDDWVSCVHASNNLILTGCYDNTIRLWTTKGDSLLTIPGHTQPVKCVSWIKNESGEKHSFMSGSHDQTVLLWQWDENSNEIDCVHSCRGHAGSVDCLAVDQSGQRFCSGSWDKMLKLWSAVIDRDEEEADEEENPKKKKKMSGHKVQTRVPLLTLSGHTEGVSAVAWLAEQEVSTASWDHTIRLWDLEKAEEKLSLQGNKVFLDMSYSPLNRMLVTGSSDRHVRLWDPRTSDGAIVKCTYTSHNGWVSSVAWSTNNEHQFLSGSYDNLLKLWDKRSPKAPLYNLVGHTDKILAVDWSIPTLMMSGGSDNQLRIFHYEEMKTPLGT